MRHIFLLLAGFFLIHPFVKAQEEKTTSIPLISLEIEQAELIDVITELSKQTGVFFSYESSILKNIPNVSLTVKNQSLMSCLQQLLTPLFISYKIVGKVVVLKRLPRQVTISGFIRDKLSSEPLTGASVFELATRKGTVSNDYGFFSIKLSPENIRLQISYIGYKSSVYTFSAIDKDTAVFVDLIPGSSLKEVIVTASEQENKYLRNTYMGFLEINPQTIRSTPVLFGEADIVKTLQLTPGVVAGTEGLAGMYVRGGSVDENLFLIDGNPVYQVNHVGGIFSAFNSEAIRGMNFFKAAFPARYGGRLSSVVDVYTKEGNMKEFHGNASIGLISANINLEGPIVKDKTSFMIALRRTWLDALTIPGLAIINNYEKKNGHKTRVHYAFHDLNMKLNHHFNDKSRVFVSFYNGNDALKVGGKDFDVGDNPINQFVSDTEASLRWGNLLATAGWTYVFNNHLFGKFTGFFSQYRSSMKRTLYEKYKRSETDEYNIYDSETKSVTGITDFGFRSVFDYIPSTSHHVRFGGDFVIHRFRPEYSRISSMSIVQDDTFRINTAYRDDLLWSREMALFVEDDWDLSPAFRLNIGLRSSLFNIDRKTYMYIEPRLSMRWLLNDQLSLKTSYSRMNQYVHMVSNSYISLPTDAWMPVTKNLKPLVSDQVSAGLYYNWKKQYDFSVEGYYKHLNNLLEYKDDYTNLSSFVSWEKKMAVGSGRAYGVEFMARKQAGRITGWLGYTLSWADRKFAEVNNGVRFPSRYDNRHKLNIVLTHKLSSKVELSAAWTYTSGNRTTISLENYKSVLDEIDQDYYEDSGLDYYEERNNYQLPDYHRLDLGITFYRLKKKGRLGVWNISIYNVYNRINPFMLYKTHRNELMPDGSYKRKPYFKQIGIIPILPSITYTYKF